MAETSSESPKGGDQGPEVTETQTAPEEGELNS